MTRFEGGNTDNVEEVEHGFCSRVGWWGELLSVLDGDEEEEGMDDGVAEVVGLTRFTFRGIFTLPFCDEALTLLLPEGEEVDADVFLDVPVVVSPSRPPT